jgi:hypothetical protein
MILSEIKVGGAYAYVPNYDQYRSDQYCYSLPDAYPVVVVERVKEPVGNGMDVCGRPTNKRQTILVAKQYSINAANMLAMDLDIIDEKHPELVTEVRLPVKELSNFVWEWDKEVEKVRNDHSIKLEIARFEDYLSYLSTQVCLWLYEAGDFAIEVSGASFSVDDPLDIMRLDVKAAAGDSEFKSFIYDTLTGYTVPTEREVRSRYGRRWSYQGVGDIPCPQKVEIFSKIEFSAAFPYRRGVYNEKRGFWINKDGKATYAVNIEEEMHRRIGMLLKVRKARKQGSAKPTPEEIEKISRETAEKFAKMGTQARLNAVEAAINATREQMESDFGGHMTPFDRNQDYKALADQTRKQALALRVLKNLMDASE